MTSDTGKNLRPALVFLFVGMAVTIALSDRAQIHPDVASARLSFQAALDGVVHHTVDGPHVYRVLVYYLEWALARGTGIPPLMIDFFLKSLLLLGIQWVFFSYLARFFSVPEAILGTVLLMLVQAASFGAVPGQWPSETMDLLNVFVFTLCVSLINAERFIPLLLLLFAGTLNRETTWLLLPIIAFRRFPERPDFSTLITATFAVAIPYFGVRLLVDTPEPSWWTMKALPENVGFLLEEYRWDAIVANVRLLVFLGPFLALSACRFREHPSFLLLTGSVIAPYILVHYLVGKIIEIRLWIPLLVILIPLALSGLSHCRKRG
jgi:hypothetical protein